MLKILSISLLLVLSLGVSHAEIYKCKDAYGKVTITDDPSLVPTGCKPELFEDFPPPITTSDSQDPAQDRQTHKKPVASALAQTENESLQSKADRLVEQYTTARRNIFYSTLAKDKLKARNDRKDIRLQKQQLLLEVEQSGLSDQEKEEINATLSAISESD